MADLVDKIIVTLYFLMLLSGLVALGCVVVGFITAAIAASVVSFANFLVVIGLLIYDVWTS